MNSFKKAIIDSAFYRMIVAICLFAKESFFLRPNIYKGKGNTKEGTKKSWFANIYNKIADYLELLYKPIRKAFFESLFMNIVFKIQSLIRGSYTYKILSKFNLIFVVILYVYVDKLVRITGFGIASIWDELLMIGIVAWLIIKRILCNKRYEFSDLDLPIIIFMLIYTTIMFVYSPDLAIGIEGLRAVIQYMFFFFFSVQLITSHTAINIILNIYVVSMGLMGVHGTYQYFTGAEMLGNWVDSGETISTRAYSIVGSPNVLGSLMVLAIPIAFAMFIANKDIIAKIIYLACTVFMGTCLIFTFSRGAWITAFIAIIIVFLFVARNMVITLITVSLGLVMNIDTLWQRVSYLFTNEYMAKSAVGGRLYRWSYALDKWEKTKVFGLGVGRFGGAVATNHKLSPFYMDNYYLKTLVEAGYAGLYAMLALFLFTVIRLFMYIRSTVNERYRIIMMGIFSGLVGVLIHNAAENIFEYPALIVYFWTLAGLIVAMYKVDLKNKTR